MSEHELAPLAGAEEIRALQTQLEQLDIAVPEDETKQSIFGPGTRKAVEDFQRAHALEPTGGVDTATRESLRAALASSTYVVTGTVTSTVSSALGGLAVELIDRNVGGASESVAATKTAGDGSFAFGGVILGPGYMRRHSKTSPDLQVQISDAGGAIVASSEVRYNAGPSSRFKVALPESAALPSEYDALLGTLTAAYGGDLRALDESAKQGDITYLAKKTGWDARAVAMAALADHLSVDMTAGKIRAEFFYALFRGGVPADPGATFLISAARAEAIWKQAIADNIISSALAKEIPAALETFKAQRASAALTSKAPAAVSTLTEMLAITLTDPAMQSKFAAMQSEHGDDVEGFWKEIEQTIGPAETEKLQLTGQLFTLTCNHAPLVAALLKAEQKLTSAKDLVASGYYEAAKWTPLIGQAGIALPPGTPGATLKSQQGAYAELLAAQLRLAYPTAVIADQVKRGRLPLAGSATAADDVHAFLSAHADTFQLGSEPVEQYLARNKVAGTPEHVLTHVKRLQRVYQLTPDDAAMATLLAHKLDSAYAVSRYDAASFRRVFSEKLGSAAKADAVHARAKQIAGAVLNAAVAYLGAKVSPALASHVGQALTPLQPADAALESAPYATLEALFGSLDYCDCSDCGSVLSPAAYMVDLLNFIDHPSPTDGSQNPLDVLLARRPDLQYLPLTCENTNTALPYIDLVNETLEYYVANSLSIANYQGHTTGDAITSAELLASPQFVNDAAYATLEGAYFPPPLPFNRPLTLLRLQLGSLGVALPDLMAALRIDDSLTNRSTPLSYGWTDILLEQCTISREENSLFSDPAVDLGALYGLPSATALATLQSLSLQDFSRRLDVSYTDLAALLQTGFINPDAALIPRLEQLALPFSTLAQLEAGALSAADFIQLLPVGLDATEYGGVTADDFPAVAAWVVDPNIYPRLTGILTIRQALPGDPCSATSLQICYTNPDPTAQAPTATDYLKIIRFIRLAQRFITLFGASDLSSVISQTDDVLNALYPSASLPVGSSNAANDASNRLLLDQGFSTLLLRLGFLLQVMNNLSLTSSSLDQLLACWAPIGTYGADSLYSQLFLTPALLQQAQRAQTATIAGTIFPGEILSTTISGVPLTYTAAIGDTADSIAIAIAGLINSCNAIDVVSGLPINQRFFASGADGVVTVRTGFSLVCSTSAGATESLTVTDTSPVAQSITVSAPTVTAGDTLSVAIDGAVVSIAVAATDTAETLATALTSAISTSTAQDPYSGLPLNDVVLAAASGAEVTLIASNAGTPFDLLCSISNPAATYVLGAYDPGGVGTITIAGAATVGDTFTVSIGTLGEAANFFETTYTALAADADPTVLAANLANALIQATWIGDETLGAASQISSSGSVVTIDGVHLLMTAFACAVTSASGCTATAIGPSLQSYSATINGTAPPAAVLTTTVAGTAYTYTVTSADTTATVSANLAAVINAAQSTYVAAGEGNVVTVSRTSPYLIEFGMSCSIVTVGGYVLGPAIPSHWTTTVSDVPVSGDVIHTTIDNVDVVYALTGDDINFFAPLGPTDISAAINATADNDALSGLPLNQTVKALPGGLISPSYAGSVFITAIDPTTSFTVACDAEPNAGGWPYTYTASGPTNAFQTATLSDPLPPGTLLTTTINGIDFRYIVQTGDLAANIVTTVAASINSSQAVDPSSGESLMSLVSAATSAGTMTITALNFATPFTLSVTISAGTYTSSRQQSPFADDGYGNFLSDPSQTVLGYEPLLCAACNLSGTEFDLIVNQLRFDATTPLTLDNVSLVFRYGWLAHALGISVLEFLAMRIFTGLDPFITLDPGAPPSVPPPVLPFTALLQAMSAAGLKPVQALYLIWNQDIAGGAAPPASDVQALAASLRASFATVEAQFSLESDPDGSIAQSLMTLVYGSAATDFFFGLLNNTLAPAVAYANPPGDPTLPQSLIDSSAGRLAYDDLRKQLSFAGVLDNATESMLSGSLAVNTTDATVNSGPGAATVFTPASMQDIVPGSVLIIDSGAAAETLVVSSTTATTFTAATVQAHNGTATPVAIVNDPSLPAALAALEARSDALVQPFFATYPELQPLFQAYAVSTDPLQNKRTALLSAFLPGLKSKRKQEQALASITAALGTDPTFAGSLLEDPSVLHADGASASAAVADLTAIEAVGLTASIFLGNNLSAAPDLIAAAVPLALSLQSAQVGGAIASGDVLVTTINGVTVSYTVTAAATTPALVAADIAAAINGTTGPDPVSTMPLNQVFYAAASGAAVIIAGFGADGVNRAFTLLCSVSSGAETYAAGAPTPTLAVEWTGCVSVLADGLYDFSFAADPAATVAFAVDGDPVPLVQAGNVWSNAESISLSAGALTTLLLSVSSATASVAVSWQTTGTGWQPVTPSSLYASSLLAQLTGSYVRFLKVTSLATALSLTANEISALATTASYAVNTTASGSFPPGTTVFSPASMTNIAVGSQLVIDAGPAQENVKVTATTATSFTAATTIFHSGAIAILDEPQPAIGQGWLNLLGAVALPDPLTSAGLRDVLSALLDFSRIKQALSPGDERLLAVLEDPGAVLSNGQFALASLTGWAIPSINALLTRFFGSIDPGSLSSMENFRRVYDAYAFVTTCRVTAAKLISATTNNPSANTVDALQSALRALYAEADWQTVIQPINDTSRMAQRDALVAYILQQLSDSGSGVQTTDQLYAYFLVDSETQPAVETSRIRLALSSIQLFVERVVRNLEPNIDPSNVNAAQWTWMKRYRVWQANREIFLWPENWLYPELRDDASPFFDSIRTALLQSDITDDLATNAYLDYLSNLEEVAKLEPCGLYYLPATATTDEATYVVARTAGGHRKYYFRQLSGGSWTPWVEVKIECEGLPLTPVVWNGRLFLFWLKAIKQIPVPATGGTPPNNTSVSGLTPSQLQQNAGTNIQAQSSGSITVSAALCWTEFYNGKWQPTKTSDLNRPTIIGVFDAAGEGSFETVRETLTIVPGIYGGSAALLGVTQDIEGALLLSVEPVSLAYAAGTQNNYEYPLDGSGRGFLLHNTHSLPVRFEDLSLNNVPMRVLLDPPPYGRLLEPLYEYTGNSVGSTAFSISYIETANVNTPSQTYYSNDILQFTWQPRYVQAQPQPDESGWTNPFFYEDRKSIFYVSSTTYFFFGILRRDQFGISSAAAGTHTQISLPPIARPGLGSTALTGAGSTMQYRGATINAAGRFSASTRSERKQS